MAIDDRPVQPLIGSWFEDVRGRRYEVVAYDDAAELVEIQYFDGDVAELELSEWREKVVAEIAAPEDFGGAFDDLTEDDYGDTERPMRRQNGDGPWREIEEES